MCYGLSHFLKLVLQVAGCILVEIVSEDCIFPPVNCQILTMLIALLPAALMIETLDKNPREHTCVFRYRSAVFLQLWS